MGQVLIRNIDDAALERLRARAARKNTSLEGELREILTSAAREGRPDACRKAAALRKTLSGRKHSDSTKLVRADRDR